MNDRPKGESLNLQNLQQEMEKKWCGFALGKDF